jgi:hypothetical protein
VLLDAGKGLPAAAAAAAVAVAATAAVAVAATAAAASGPGSGVKQHAAISGRTTGTLSPICTQS